MDSTDGAAVHVVLPNQKQQQTKAEAALQEAAAYRGPAHNETATWSNDDPAKPDPSWSSCTMWTLFAVGWLFTPCWWLGVASGLTSGGDRSCLLRRRRGLKQGQKAAWWAHVIMSLVSALVVLLVCAIYFGNTGPERTAPSYLVLSGREDAYPNLNDQLKLRKVADALHAALNLDATYPAANIRIWLAAAQTTSATPTRHLLEVRTKVVVLGYSLAKVSGLPEPDALAALLQDTATTQRLAQELTAAEYLAPEFSLLVSIGFAPPAAATPEDALLQLIDGSGAGQHFLAPIGVLLNHSDDEPPIPGPGPYYLLMAGDSRAVPSLTDAAVLAKVSQALHGAFNLSANYPVSDIQVSLQSNWTFNPPDRKRKLLTPSQWLAVVLRYSFSTSEGLPTQEDLEACMNNTVLFKVLADNLAVQDFITDEDLQGAVDAGFTTSRNATDAVSQLWNSDADTSGPAYDDLEPVGKYNCGVDWQSPSPCNATSPGGSGFTTTDFVVVRPPTNGGRACPEPRVEACKRSGCPGTPLPWTPEALLASPSNWTCSNQVQGGSELGDVCNGACHALAYAPGGGPGGAVTAECTLIGNTSVWVVLDGGCSIGQPPPEFAFGPVEVSELGQLSGAEFSQAAFTGFTLHDKTNTSGPLADQLMCNGTYNFTPASTVDGDLAIVMMPSDGSMSASAVIASTNISDSNLDISLGQFWVVSLKHAATLTFTAHNASNSIIADPITTSLDAMIPQQVSLNFQSNLGNLQAAASFRFEATFHDPFCGASDVPLLVVDGMQVGRLP